MAQPDETDFAEIEKRMRACGAADFVAIPLHDMIAEAGIEVIQSQACYEGRYWNTTGIGRHVIVAGMVPEMRKRGIKILSHGATGRGNDQVRFQLCTNMLAPEFAGLRPVAGRDVPEALRRPQRDDRLLPGAQAADQGEQGRAVLDRRQPARPDARGRQARVAARRRRGSSRPGMGVLPKDAPDKPETVTVRFEQGRPVALNGKQVTAFEAI